MYTSPRFKRCGFVAPYGNDYCREHKAAREPIIIEDSESEDEAITVHDSDSEYIPESESESEYIPDSENDSENESENDSENESENDSDDSEWLPYDHKKQKRPVIVEGGGSESICDCHDDELNTAFYDYIEDEKNPNVMLIRDVIVKTRDMHPRKFNELLDYLECIIDYNNNN
jgi:hypothetical protein